MNPANYTSEDQCDIWIDQNLQVPSTGFLVDVGCAHPVKYSQSHWLRARGWDWLAIDGSNRYANEWVNQAGGEFLHAVVLDGQPTRFIDQPVNTLVSRIHPEGEFVKTEKLSAILVNRVARKIDFLCIDVEDSEPIVLADIFEWGFFPNILVAEYNSEHAGRNPETIMIPIRAGYKLVHMTNSNAVFVYTR